MSCANELTKADKVKWEQYKREMTTDRGEKIFERPTNLGNCSVEMSILDGELSIQIMPNETTLNENSDTEISSAGIIISISEDSCHVNDLMKMASNARKVEGDKEKGHAIVKFN